MREALIRIVSGYTELAGDSKILLLFVISMLALILIDEKVLDNADDEKRRRINPTVFLLSLWSGIAYVITRLISRKNRVVAALGLLFSLIAIALSGELVISKKAFELSVYSSGNAALIAISVICIILGLTAYYVLSGELFDNKSDRAIFLLLIILQHIFGLYSEKGTDISLFLSPVKIGTILIHIALPLLLWLYLKYEERIKEQADEDENDNSEINSETEEIPEEWDMKKHKILNIRNMAIVLAVLVAVFAAVIFVLNTKINSLYEATVGLEKAANSKMSVYELKDDDESVVLTLMISPEGSVTAIDGKDRSHGDAVYKFISQYTDTVDKWYIIYGDEGPHKGAHDYSIENGIKVKETFIISGVLED